MLNKMKILIADDQAEIRSALALTAEQAVDACVTEANDAVELVRRTQAVQPDLILLDWELPGLAAMRDDVASVLSIHRPGVVVVALSSRPDAQTAALSAGVDAFVCKGDGPEKLLGVLRRSFSKCREGGSE